jgi:SAM-dependent methyltransferase
METEIVETCPVCLGTDFEVLDEATALNRCVTCGFVFDSPRPTIEEIFAFYSRPVQYDEWIDDHAVRERLWNRRLRKVLRHSRSGSLLDVGAGIGQFLNTARPHFTEVTGTEVSESAVQIADERYGLTLMEGQVEEMDLGRTFDNVTMFHVLEHVPDPSHTIATCVDILAPDGRLFIAVPNEIESLKPWLKHALGKAGLPRYAGHGIVDIPRITLDGSLGEIHLSHFTVSSLRRLLERHGLEVLDAGLDPYSVAQGTRGLIDKSLRVIGEGVQRTTGRNVYDAIWMAARKPA